MPESNGSRAIGGIFIGLAAYLVASHLGMSHWEGWAVAALIGLGVPLLVTGRWKGW
jgi:hypothetical protein